nr:copia protein [Tanacetum cinerariifolium]
LSTAGPSRAFNDGELSYLDDPSMPHLEDIYASPSKGIFTDSSYDDEYLAFGKKAIRTKWVYKNKKDERGVVVRNKARLVTQEHRQAEGIDYDEVFALVARIEAIRISLAFASYMGFIVYQMDVKSAFLYGTIYEEVYVSQPPGFVDPKFPNKVYKVVKALYGLHQAPRAWSSRKKMPLVKDEEAVDVDVHLYRSMIGSLMYLTASRPDIMFAVCASFRFQVTPKSSHLQAMKRIFRYLKGQPKLGLWYPKVSLFDLEAYSNSDYAGANLDRKSTTGEGIGGNGGDQFHLPHDSPLLCGHTSGRAEGSLNLEALYALCTNLSNRVFALETVKDTQAKEILTLKARIKKLEKRCKPSISHHQAWLRSVSPLSKKKKLSKKKSVSKQESKNAKSRPTKDGSDKFNA